MSESMIQPILIALWLRRRERKRVHRVDKHWPLDHVVNNFCAIARRGAVASLSRGLQCRH